MSDSATNPGNGELPKPTGLSPATRQATPRQRNQALWACAGIFLVTLLLVPAATVIWPNIPAFLPTYQTATIVAYLIISYLVLGHYRATKGIDLLCLGCGCLYASMMLLLQFLAIPGMFQPQSAVLGGAQTMSWLWFLWHAGLALGILMYAICQLRPPGPTLINPRHLEMLLAVVLAVAVIASLAMVTVYHDRLPIIDQNGNYRRAISLGLSPLLQLMYFVSLLILWHAVRFRSVLQVWLGVALVALLCENAITLVGGSRFSVGWYVGRCNALISATVLLTIYLREINQVYLKTVQDARILALSNAMLEVRMDQVRMDDLTGLPGRSLFLELAETLRSRSLINCQAVAVLFIDLDGFKWINDNLGHKRGDAVLVEVAAALRSLLRDIDIAARVGGDEFVVCLVAPALSIKATATAVAERIVSRVAAIGDGIGCSIGIALCQAEDLEWDLALRHADEAMYQAKRQGKSRFAVYGHALLDAVV